MTQITINTNNQLKMKFPRGIFNAHHINQNDAVLHLYDACLTKKDIQTLIDTLCIIQDKMNGLNVNPKIAAHSDMSCEYDMEVQHAESA